MTSPYTKTYFVRNRKRLQKELDGLTPLVLTANMLVQYSADSAFPFRQDNNFWYITGIDEPDFMYVFDGVKDTLILPKPNAVRDVFDGSIDTEKIKKISGIDRVVSYKRGLVLLKQIVKKHQHIATLLPATALQTRYGVSPNPARKQLLLRLRRLQAGLTFQHIGTHFAHLRVVKTSEELTAIQASIDLTGKAIASIKPIIKAGVFEYEVEAAITKYFRTHNARHAYPPIIAAGANATTLHYGKNNARLTKGSQLLLDVGAEKFRGAADISRTYSIGTPKKQLTALHAAVAELQDFAYSILKPGVLMHDYERHIEKQMGKTLKALGIIKHVSRKQVRTYYPHATSHFLGLDVHDSADYSRPLEAGNVLTVEPGIYIPDKGIGVRIEDDVLITKDGVEILSKNLPRDL